MFRLAILATFLCCGLLRAQALAIRTDELPLAIKGVPYDSPIVTYTNGRCPDADVALTLASGSLPKGLELSTAGVQGTPEQIGHFRFSVRASNNCLHVTKDLDMIVDGKPILMVFPSQVSFQYQQGSADPPEDAIKVESSTPDLPYSYAVSSAAWLKAGEGNGRTPERESALTGDRVPLKIDPANLAPGHYQGSIKFYTRGGENAPIVKVTLQVTDSEETPED